MIDTKGLGAYDQAGSCFGCVKIFDKKVSSYIEGSPSFVEHQLNLPGLRKRVYGSREGNDLYRLALLTGVMSDGSVFEVGASSGKFGLTQ